LLSNAGVSYRNQPSPPGALALIRIGATEIPAFEGAGLSSAALKSADEGLKTKVAHALEAARYPTTAAPSDVNVLGLYGVMMIFVIAATALFGPIAATLVELFPMRIRYTAMSLPYHVGTGWVGGFVPVSAFAIVTATGDIYAGLWYPVIFTALSVLTLPFLLPETRGRSAVG